MLKNFLVRVANQKKIKILNFGHILCLIVLFIVFNLKITFADHTRELSTKGTSDVAVSIRHFQRTSKYLTNNRGVEYQVSLENYQSDYLADKPTWIVIHGFGHSPSNLEDQELQQNLKASGVQVLQIDWSSITKQSILSLWAAASFIPSMGEFVANSLTESKVLSGENVNCIGHSFGSYICWEIAKRIENFNRLIALEPASKKGLSLLWKQFYSISKIDFSRYTQYSLSFKSSDRSSERAVLTADDSFLIEYNDYPDNRHNDVIGFLSTLIRRNYKGEGGSVSRALDLKSMDENSQHPWMRDKLGYEGTILIQNENSKNNLYRWLPVSLNHSNGVIEE
jgi:pimeloyl-ACP methyl ester carboxylesterase